MYLPSGIKQNALRGLRKNACLWMSLRPTPLWPRHAAETQPAIAFFMRSSSGRSFLTGRGCPVLHFFHFPTRHMTLSFMTRTEMQVSFALPGGVSVKIFFNSALLPAWHAYCLLLRQQAGQGLQCARSDQASGSRQQGGCGVCLPTELRSFFVVRPALAGCAECFVELWDFDFRAVYGRSPTFLRSELPCQQRTQMNMSTGI